MPPKIVDNGGNPGGNGGNGPISADNVLHIVDLSYVPKYERAFVKEHILKGVAKKASEPGKAISEAGIIFINDR